MNESSTGKLPGLPNISFPLKVLFSGYLLCIGVGLLTAGLQIMMTHGMADGKVGLSFDDIVYSYYGNRSGTKLESMLNGSMKGMAPPEVRLEIIEWARDGAPESRWAPKFQAVFEQHCSACHNENSPQPDFRRFEQVQKYAAADGGITFSSLTRVSHIHLFGIAFIFTFVGGIFYLSVGLDERVKGYIIAVPFAFLLLDILSWWLTKFSPGFALITMLGGVGYSVASTIMWLVSFYQMWFYQRFQKIAVFRRLDAVFSD